MDFLFLHIAIVLYIMYKDEVGKPIILSDVLKVHIAKIKFT
jgi:hypothetical protein